MFYKTPFFSIYFGNAQDGITVPGYRALAGSGDLAAIEPYARVCNALGVTAITFGWQVHGTVGLVVEKNNPSSLKPFTHEVDFLVTNQPIALGVMTGDCLPVILYDPITHTVGIAHAGWKGTIAGIVREAIACMTQQFGVNAANLQCFFGPAARACCYEVTAEFKEYLACYDWHEQVLQQRDGKLFFDKALCNSLILQDAGVKRENIGLQHARCTMCLPEYCSYRREKEKAGRQMTVVALTPG